ncbi:prepilin peptidase [Butyrivibrio sp. NC3005]|uniref:prepilin peptidase n=1 Tax=Butyrivibrio sp. NC3005 TaxID=1280685 RepID=UPI0003F9D086|nr:prepilin peptidase [Butyrivibrio sp. NC3005]
MLFIVVSLIILLIAGLNDIKNKSVKRWMIISNFICGISCLLVQLFLGGNPLVLFLSFIPGLFLISLSFITREKIGYGDGLIALGTGPVFGISNLMLGFCISFFLSGMTAGILMIFKKAKRDEQLPFLPFMFAGLLVVSGVCLAARIEAINAV